MSSIGVSLPLQIDGVDGYGMNKTIKKVVNQNLKMLLLTNPGERVMEPNFGVGIQRYLFENFGQEVSSAIESKIREQVGIYMPGIQLRNIVFGLKNQDSSYLGIRIEYAIPSIGIKDLLELTN